MAIGVRGNMAADIYVCFASVSVALRTRAVEAEAAETEQTITAAHDSKFAQLVEIVQEKYLEKETEV